MDSGPDGDERIEELQQLDRKEKEEFDEAEESFNDWFISEKKRVRRRSAMKFLGANLLTVGGVFLVGTQTDISEEDMARPVVQDYRFYDDETSMIDWNLDWTESRINNSVREEYPGVYFHLDAGLPDESSRISRELISATFSLELIRPEDDNHFVDEELSNILTSRYSKINGFKDVLDLYQEDLDFLVDNGIEAIEEYILPSQDSLREKVSYLTNPKDVFEDRIDTVTVQVQLGDERVARHRLPAYRAEELVQSDQSYTDVFATDAEYDLTPFEAYRGT